MNWASDMYTHHPELTTTAPCVDEAMTIVVWRALSKDQQKPEDAAAQSSRSEDPAQTAPAHWRA
jgi:hypothetical protein